MRTLGRRDRMQSPRSGTLKERWMKNTSHISFARELRKNMTQEEKKLWYQFLRTYPVRFMRQRPIDRYIVDFYCAKARLVIELDGSQHFETEGQSYGAERDCVLNNLGLKVLRIPNNAVNQNFTGVCEFVDLEVQKRMKR